MKKINLLISISCIFCCLLISTTTFAQEGTELQSTKQKKVLKAQNKKGSKVVPQNKLTPEQRKAIKEKQAKLRKLTPEQRVKLKEAKEKAVKSKPVRPMVKGGKMQKLNANKATPITKTQLKNRNRDISKAKAISKINKGNGRAKAADSKLAAAKAKLEQMKASGKYSAAEIQKKEAVLAKYETQLGVLKKSLETGSSTVKN